MRDLPAPAFRVAQALNQSGIPGLTEATASYETVGLYVDPNHFRPESVELLPKVDLTVTGKRVQIPVHYELGEDLARVCAELRMTQPEFVAVHSGAIYTCAAVGFSPGFAYLGPVAASIRSTTRLATPRIAVPAGAVALAGNQTAVYPHSTPGGWNLIGQTPLEMVNVANDYFPISAGDEVEFFAVTAAQFRDFTGDRL